MPEPTIAVLLPLQEARGFGEASVQAWANQTLPRERYEIVLLAPGEDPRLERAARDVMAPHDRWVEVPGADEYALFDRGAELTDAPWVFLTEVHCVPEPKCLEAMLEHLERTGQPGARGVSIGVGHGRIGELEREVFEEHLAPGGDDDHWRKVLIHSLAIRTPVLRAAGGFPARYGDFAPWVLAIALRESGHRLGFATQSAVHHHYTGELPELLRHVRDFAMGEMRYWQEAPGEVCSSYLDQPEEWAERGETSRTGARRLLRQLSAARLPTAVSTRTTARLCGSAVAGPHLRLLPARVRLLGWRLRMAAESVRRRPSGRVYRAMWEACARAARWEYLARTPQTTWLPPWLGVHAEETHAGRPLHWTGPVATFELVAPPGAAACLVELVAARPLESGAVPRVLLNGQVIDADVDGTTVRVALRGRGSQRLGLVSRPLRPWRHGVDDRRELGVAIADIRWA